MRNAARTLFLSLLAVVSAVSIPCFAQDTASRMEQVVQWYVGGNRFMGSVLVARGDKILLNKGYGSADLEWDIPNSSTTKFRIGSLTKQFTAAAILLLEQRGKLKIDDPVKKYMPDAPAAWDKVTIFNLLTHTSGIPSFTSFPDYHSTEATPTTPEKLVERFRDKPLEFQPGEKWNYSNSGYVLLGYLIEKISGQSYKDFLQENFFKPLGMNDSGYDSNSAIIVHRAEGYTPSASKPMHAGYIDMSIPFSAGGLYSTTGDLLRWEQGLFGGKVLSQESLKKMTTPFKNDYAFGLGVLKANGHTIIEHNGGIEGFNAHMSYCPDDSVTVVVLANLNGNVPSELATKLMATAHGEKVVLPSERKEITLPKEVMARYTGTYELTPGFFSIAITLEGDQLVEQAISPPPIGPQPKAPIYPESETRFFMKVVDAQLEFSKDEKGEFTVMTLHQNGRDIKGVKK